MPAPLTTDSFAQIVRLSGLVVEDRMAEMKQKYPGDTGSAESWSELLVRLGYVTPWQAEKLLQAKHRGFFLGRYCLLSRLARGGMSNIYAARDVSSRDDCVLKVLPLSRAAESSYLPRFRREAAIARRLEHPNVIRVFGLHCASDGKSDIHFMAMERLHGENLFEKVSCQGALSLRAAAELMLQAARALDYAHSAGLVHRDIKPANLLLTNDGIVKIIDLGLASMDCLEQDDLTRQYDERVLGTADYLAPEQAVDSHEADSRADIYALGCTLYFLLTGEPPFPDGNLAQRILSHQTKQPRPITSLRTEIPKAFSQILDSMLVKNRELRTQTAGHVADALSAWLSMTAHEPRFSEAPDHAAVCRNEDRRYPGPRAADPTAAHSDAQSLTSQGFPVCDEASGSGVYTPEFEAFLRGLDEESGIRTVVDSDDRNRHLRTVSRLRPDADDADSAP